MSKPPGKKKQKDDEGDFDISILKSLPKELVKEAVSYIKDRKHLEAVEALRKKEEEEEYLKIKCIPPWAKTYGGGKRLEECVDAATQWEDDERKKRKDDKRDEKRKKGLGSLLGERKSGEGDEDDEERGEDLEEEEESSEEDEEGEEDEFGRKRRKRRSESDSEKYDLRSTGSQATPSVEVVGTQVREDSIMRMTESQLRKSAELAAAGELGPDELRVKSDLGEEAMSEEKGEDEGMAGEGEGESSEEEVEEGDLQQTPSGLRTKRTVSDLKEDVEGDGLDLGEGGELEKDKKRLSTKDSDYVKQHFGRILAESLAEIAWKRPADPIHYLAHRLYHARHKEEMRENYTCAMIQLNEAKIEYKKEKEKELMPPGDDLKVLEMFEDVELKNDAYGYEEEEMEEETEDESDVQMKENLFDEQPDDDELQLDDDEPF